MQNNNRPPKKYIPNLIYAAVTFAVFLIAFAVYTVTTGQKPSFAAVIISIVFSAALNLILHFVSKKAELPDFGAHIGKSALPQNITLDFITKLSSPVVICDDSGKIIWYNKATSLANQKRDVLYGTYIEALCGAKIADIISCDDENGFDANISESVGDGTDSSSGIARSYRIKAQELNSSSKQYYVLMFYETTEYYRLMERRKNEETAVIYAMIDNLEEVLGRTEEGYRRAVSDVENVLRKYVDSYGGVMKEFEREKYIILLENRYLDTLIEQKFPLLDEIREIRVGDANIPVTVSMGISKNTGTLVDKERQAKEALDMALARGGDQVAVKSVDSIEYYGGRTKTVQKRTKVRARVTAMELVDKISNSKNVIVMGHKFADFDSFGAGIGIIRLCKYCGASVNFVLDVDDKNLTPVLSKVLDKPEYDGVFVDRQKAMDFVTSETLLIVVDVNNVSLFEAPDLFDTIADTVVIDHHRKTAEFKNPPAISYIEPSASSACELVSELLEQVMPVGSLPKEEADLMFAGIMLDTKQFSRNTGVRTFSAALYLRGEGANPVDAQKFFRTTMEDFARQSKFESNVVIYRENIAISASEAECDTSDRITAAKVADKLLTIDGVSASFALCKIEDTVHISARSQNNINVQVILEKLSGGGHFDNAGAQVVGVSMQKALGLLRDAIDEYFEENV
ncbi:MAG: DHH family phosphoesterase [Clostridia bacterium]|nr:DHH family phosphoesterase [Clostridia bacterium]